ncbi:sigma-70 family RNA polymerase sigma factor [uncultured Treponema sp.]|uniref:sigma-70 family RNA polymerase sigma factor n=1 Tax=uncultured Treponema sp. TaxID=162155 RepID=UPI002599DB05|nr:sigma-70 family RNA polymerase sigma factor [uncultured Treponema sp.]
MAERSLDKAFNLLMQKSKEQGYLLFDDVFKMAEDYELDVSDIDKLSSRILENGVILLDQKPVNKKIVKTNTENTENFEDWSHNDYEPVFSEIIEKEPKQEFFINYIRNIVPPQRREMQTLQYQLLEGNKFARKRVIEMHLRLAVKQALKFSKQFEQDLNEMISCSCEGLILAADAYKPDKNGQFSAYASLWIMQVMKRNVLTKKTLIYYPSHFMEKYLLLKRNQAKLGILSSKDLLKLNIQHKIENLLQIKLDDVKKICLAFIPFQNINNFIDNDSIDVESEIITWNFQDKDYLLKKQDPLNYVINELLKEQINDLLYTLPDKEREILKMRFGLYNTKFDQENLLSKINHIMLSLYKKGSEDKDKKTSEIEGKKLLISDYVESRIVSKETLTLEEIAKYYNIPRRIVRLIEAKALRRLRHPRRIERFRDYFD